MIRAWLASHRPRIDWVDVCDHGYACWRGLRAAFGAPGWDPLELDDQYIRLAAAIRSHASPGVPAPGGRGTAGSADGHQPGTALPTLAPSPALNLVLPCPVCAARSNAPCVNRYGETTGPHKARRDAATAAAHLASTP